MNYYKNSSLWVEKYRPQHLSDLTLTKNIRTFVEHCIKEKDIPNMLIYSTAGTGKTSLIKVLMNELNADYLYINGSKYNSIQVLRDDITQYVSTYGMDDSELPYKIVFIDEAEKLSSAFQEALKVDMEELSNNARFIFITNNVTKILDPLRSRFTQGTFNMIPSNKEERAQLAGDILKRLDYVMKQENMEYDRKVIVELIIKHFPDFRSMIGSLQKYSIMFRGMPVDAKILEFGKGISDELVSALISKDIKRLRVLAIDTDAVTFFRDFDSTMYNIIEDDFDNIVKATLILGKYAFENGSTTDELITLRSCFITLATQIKFKKI